MTMRWLTAVWLSVMLAVPLTAAEPPARFLLAHGSIGGSTVPLWTARDQGIFRKYNLEPQLIYIIAGRAIQSMLAGDLNFGLIGATHVTNAVTGGGDMTMLLGLESKLQFILVARPNVKKAEDLKGKKIAIGTPSGSVSLATYVGLDYLGLMPRRDNIVLLGVGSPQERLAAFLAGSVDAAFFQPEMAQIPIQQGYTMLLDLGKENVPFQSSGLATSHKFMRSNPQLVENLAKAIVEAVAYVSNPVNKKKVVEIIARNLRLDKPDRLEIAYQSIAGMFPRKPCPSLPGIASVLKLMAQHGLNPKAAELKPEDIADMSLCKKLDKTGFFDRVQQQG
jgi:ABC-type nitrate/sulfonate/bicarbonate transport system substrate-binding protein